MNTRRRLVFRVYAFTASLALAVMVVLFVLPRYTRAGRYLEPQAALIQHIIDRYSLKNPQEFTESMNRFEPRLRGKLTLYDANLHVVRSNAEHEPDPPSAEEMADLKSGKWVLDWGRILVRSDDGSMIGVYAPNRPGFPWFWVLPCGAIMLLLIGAASLWFSRRLARPLEQLALAAHKFGAGDLTARAALKRDDELGEVGCAFDDMAARTAGVLISQRQLMADVSHELRTPLARIRVALELVAEDPIAASDVLSDVGVDLDEIDQLIADILTTARLDTDQARINRRSTRVDELVAESTDRFTARHPGRKLDQRIETDETSIVCDPVLLRRALDNLLDNAAKYSDPTTPLRLEVKPVADRAVFEVVDKGIGMSADELERAFTPFWRADTSRTRKTGGVGLGLALARRIARAHAGDITLASKPNVGTTARLEIPL